MEDTYYNRYFELKYLIEKSARVHNVNNVKKYWKELFTFICKEFFDFDNNAIEQLFDWGSYGYNWSLLHFDKSEIHENKDYNKLMDCFLGELSYISDRMSMDRLLRSHWLYNAYMNIFNYSELRYLYADATSNWKKYRYKLKKPLKYSGCLYKYSLFRNYKKNKNSLKRRKRKE